MSDELKIFWEDIQEKFDKIIEGIYMIVAKLDRHIEKSLREQEKFEIGLLELRRNINEHRNNTELHGGKINKEAS